MMAQPDNVCDALDVGQTCSHQCQSGFSGGSVTCSGRSAGGTDSAESSCVANGDCAFAEVACTAAGGADPAAAQPCDNGPEPDWAGGSMAERDADSCDGTADGATCVHTCQSGFSGGSVTCSDGGGGGCAANGDCAFTVVACTERDAAEPAACPSPSPPPTLCTRPALGDDLAENAPGQRDLAGYVVTENNLEQNNFQVAVQCAAGYRPVGNVRATACTGTDGGEYELEGCAPTQCSTRTGDNPNTYPGYTQLVEVNLQIGGAIGFAVTASCAEGYAGNAVVTACANHGEDYGLSGCAAIVCTRRGDRCIRTAQTLPLSAHCLTAPAPSGRVERGVGGGRGRHAEAGGAPSGAPRGTGSGAPTGR